MPLFISYSHSDKEFVDKLAIQLVRRNVHVWLDRWELSVGDSLVDKVQEAVDGASALLVILSKASVGSEWCKKELSAGLLRELEERRVVVLPVLLEDCDIPVFARGKLFADFRKDFDSGLRAVVEGVAKVTTPSLGRFSEPTYHTDWSIDWGTLNDLVAITLNYVQLPFKEPYTCLTNVEILANEPASERFQKQKGAEGVDFAKLHILQAFVDHFEQAGPLRPTLDNEREKVFRFIFTGATGSEQYSARVGARRLGQDTGRDILLNVSGVIKETFTHMNAVLSGPKADRS